MANPVLNPSFEDPALVQGEADQWTQSMPAAGAEEIGTFGAGTEETPWEGFEGGWSWNETAQMGFYLTDLFAGMFEDESQQYEPFDYSWSLPMSYPPSAPRFNHQSAWEYQTSNHSIGKFDSTYENYEDFEEEWDSNEDAVASWAYASYTAGAFDSGTPQDVEDFEEEWHSNEDFDTGFSSGPDPNLTAGLFDGDTHAYDSFEGTWTLTYP